MIEAMKQALEALEESHPEAYRHAITSLRQAIEQAEKPFYKVEGPLHVVCQCDKCKAQPQREWVGLTDEERMDILLNLNWDKKLSHMDTALAIEAKLKEKNT